MLKNFLKTKYERLKVRQERRIERGKAVYFWGGSRKAKKTGIFLRGGCDVVAAFSAEQFIHPNLQGTCCIYKSGIGAASSLSSLMLQSLETFPEDAKLETIEKFKLNPTYFDPVLFEPTFTFHGLDGPEQFKKDVVILSIGPDMVRTLYRHKTAGFVIDPGGWWLNQSMDRILDNMQTVVWFKRTFEKMGPPTLEQSFANYRRIIQEVKARTGAHILFFNILGVEPSDPTYNYGLVRNHNMIRRREYNLGLYDLSREMDVSVVDIDRLLKREGVEEQVDFAHWPKDKFKPIGREVYNIIHDRGVV